MCCPASSSQSPYWQPAVFVPIFLDEETGLVILAKDMQLVSGKMEELSSGLAVPIIAFRGCSQLQG